MSYREFIPWAPRVICAAYGLFLSVFALDARTPLALLMHMLPALTVFAMMALAWKREWIGMAGSLALAMLFFWWNLTVRHNAASAVLAIAGPLILLAGLYLAAWRVRIG